MKKLLVVMGLCLAAASVYASCTGPYCWDESGAYVNGSAMDGNGAGMPSLTVSQINTAVPRFKGQEVFCNNCTSFNTFLGGICVSTGTSAGAYVAVSSASSISNCK